MNFGFATDPAVSKAQRRAMFAAAAGHSTLGISKKVGEEFTSKDKKAKDTQTAPNSAIPASLRKRAKDMKPEEWQDMMGLIQKFLSEEEDEPEHAEDRSCALDFKSQRTYDADKRLHVSRTPISKANVCEYLGKEIPNYQELGLDAGTKYKLWRHPEELKRGADTFNNNPLLSRHVPMDADSHNPDLVVGSLGTDAEFKYPYLYNSLAVYTRDAIDDIESGHKKQLSSAYRYRADMTPGRTPEGEAYDGVMREIVGNHVAIVSAGRAGDDVVVQDAKLKPFNCSFVEQDMPKSFDFGFAMDANETYSMTDAQEKRRLEAKAPNLTSKERDRLWELTQKSEKAHAELRKSR